MSVFSIIAILIAWTIAGMCLGYAMYQKGLIDATTKIIAGMTNKAKENSNERVS